MKSIPLAVADYQDGYTKCQGQDGQEGSIQAMIYNDLSGYDAGLNFPALEMYHRRSFFPCSPR
jgi:hypothetical protein